MDKATVIRDSVDGIQKYARIPVRRKRTPMYSYELEEILFQYMTENGVDMDSKRTKAAELFANDDCEEAGLLCSALDFMALFERIAFCD